MGKFIRLFIYIWVIVFGSISYNYACSFTINKTVVQPTCGSNGLISFSITPPPSSGAVYKVYKNGEFLVQISGSLANLNSLAPGTYKVVVVDNSTGCVDSLDNIVLDPAVNALSATYSVDSNRCDTSKAGKITLYLTNAKHPVTYVWNHTSAEKDSIADSLRNGTYLVTITDANNCRFELSDMKVVEVKGGLLSIDTFIVPTSCDSPIGSILVHYTGRHDPKFVWRLGTGTAAFTSFDSVNMPLDSLPAGKYSLYITDSLKCYPLEIKDLEVKKNPPPKATIIGTDSLCSVGPLGYLRVKILNGDSTQMRYSWNDGDTNKYRPNVPSGTYYLTVMDAAGCIDTPKWTIFDYPERSFQLLADKDEVVKGNTTFVRIDTITGLYDIRWYSSPAKKFDSLSLIQSIRARVDTITTYFVDAKYGPGCITKNSKTIFLVALRDDLVIPNFFSPGMDGRNDLYKLRGENNGLHSFEMNIFDRWGNIVFTTTDVKFTWNGTDLKGEPLMSGVYTYLIKLGRDSSGEREVKAGSIILER